MRKRTTGHRFFRHLVADHHRVRRAFPQRVLDAIGRAITAGEATHRGQLRFVVEGALPLGSVVHRVSARKRALEVFARAHVWDTEENCGVLIYVLLADRAVEIVADRGIHARVSDEGWRPLCAAMQAAFRAGHFEEGALAGIGAINALLAREFPGNGGVRNELPDQPLVI